MRVFYNPFNLDETWVTSFGNGIMIGGDSSSGIETMNGQEPGFRLYPNPCHETVSLEPNAPSSAVINYTIIDISGRTVMSGRSGNTPINTSGLGRGLYVLRVFCEGRCLGSSKLAKD